MEVVEQTFELKPADFRACTFFITQSCSEDCFQHKLYAGKLSAAVEKETKLKQAIF